MTTRNINTLFLFVIGLLGISFFSLSSAQAQTAISDNGVESIVNSNTRVGTQALEGVTTGSENTAIGFQALSGNEEGSFNTASGAYALWGGIGNDNNGGGNTASGYRALALNTTGFSNTAIGLDALYNNNEGGSNTAIGVSALYTNNGNNNIAMGWTAGYDLTTGDYNIAIGNRGVPAESATIRIGDSGSQTRAFIAGIRGVTTGEADAISVVIDSDGQLGIVSSSRRFKEEITEMTAASEPLLALRPVTFRYKEAYENGDKPIQYGLIAEEVAEQFPELVTFNEEGQPETVKYRLLSVLLLNELQKQNELNRQQESLLTELQGQVAELDELVRNVANMGYSEKNAVAMNATD